MGIVWSIDYFEYYLYGKDFTVITDHCAILSVLKEHRSNKSYNSRLSRWIDRLFSYNCTIEHMPGAKMGLVDYISRNSNAKAKKASTYDKHFAVATIFEICDSLKHLIRNKRNTIRKFNSILKLHSTYYSSNRPIAPQIPTLLRNNLQFHTKPVALQSLHCIRLLTLGPHLKSKNSTINPHLNIPFPSQMPSKILKPKIVPNNTPLHKSHSINKFVANVLQKSNNKECEQPKKIYPIKPILDTKSCNQHKFLKFSAKT